MIRKRCEEISKAEERGRHDCQWAWRVSIADVANDRNGEVKGKLGCDRYGVYLVLRVVQAREEEVTIDGECL
jgi:environmental stress-induced protein Ves